MKIKFIYIPLLTVIFLLVFMVSNRGEGKTKEKGGIKYNTYESFEKSVGGFPYTAPETKRKYIIENYPKLSLGMTKEQVYTFLGAPDVEKEILPKFTWERPKSRGGRWIYYIYKSDTLGENFTVDKHVYIWYDVNGKVDWITANNLEGLQNRGDRGKREGIPTGTGERDNIELKGKEQ
jgi:hypothetical protein